MSSRLRALSLDGVWTWSVFQPDREIDFNGFWVQLGETGVVFDPMPIEASEWGQFESLGRADWMLLTNADHLRAMREFQSKLGTKVLAPRQDQARFGEAGKHVDLWFESDEDLPEELAPLLSIHSIRGGKSDVEIAVTLKPLDALLFGDIVRTNPKGELVILPAAKLTQRARVIEDLASLSETQPKTLLLGDGVPEIENGGDRLSRLVRELAGPVGGER